MAARKAGVKEFLEVLARFLGDLADVLGGQLFVAGLVLCARAPLSGPRAALLPLAGSSWNRTLSAGRGSTSYVFVLAVGDRYDAVCIRRGFVVVLEDGP